MWYVEKNVQICKWWEQQSNRFHNGYRWQVSGDTNLRDGLKSSFQVVTSSAVEHGAIVAYASGGWRYAQCNSNAVSFRHLNVTQRLLALGKMQRIVEHSHWLLEYQDLHDSLVEFRQVQTYFERILWSEKTFENLIKFFINKFNLIHTKNDEFHLIRAVHFLRRIHFREQNS